MRLKTFLILLAVFALILGGCKDDDNPAAPGSSSTSYTGVISGSSVSGTISITIPVAKRAYRETSAEGDTLDISGTLKISGGATIDLTGFYVVETGEIYLTGGGYTFMGFVDEGEVSGSFTYSGGGGYFSAYAGDSSNVKTFCGRYQDNSPGEESGSFNMIISGTNITVVVYPDGGSGQSGILDGTLTGGTQIAIFSPEAPSIPVATGTLNVEANTISGTYAGDPGGTWSGSVCN